MDYDSKRTINALQKFKEVNLFLRRIVPLIGYEYAIVTYDRNERFVGESKYLLKKMRIFALDGIISFSVKPIRFVAIVEFFAFLESLLVVLYSMIKKYWGLLLVDGHF